MKALIDTSVAIRFVDSNQPQHAEVHAGLRALVGRGAELVICAQVITECWATCTRPAQANGLGMSTESALKAARLLMSAFAQVDDPPKVVLTWLELCVRHQVQGRKTFDARLAGLAIASSIPSIVTYNVADFARFNEITTIDPRTL